MESRITAILHGIAGLCEKYGAQNVGPVLCGVLDIGGSVELFDSLRYIVFTTRLAETVLRRLEELCVCHTNASFYLLEKAALLQQDVNKMLIAERMLGYSDGLPTLTSMRLRNMSKRIRDTPPASPNIGIFLAFLRML